MVRKSLRHTWLSETRPPSRRRQKAELPPTWSQKREATFRRGTTPTDRYRNACNLGQPEPATYFAALARFRKFGFAATTAFLI
jgi:hypothetical protein